MEVNKVITVFEFKGDTKAIKDTGNALQNVSENSAIAGKRVEGAGESFLSMGKNAAAGLASVTALAAGIAKITENVFQLGKETAELKGLGIDPVAFRETEDLFSRLGAADGDASNFVKKIAEAQDQLSLGLDAPFAKSIAEQFGVLIGEGDSAADVLERLREATEKQGFTAGQISVKAGELGFSPEFSKVLLATNDQFAEATEAIKNLAQADRELLEQSEEVTQAWKNLTHASERLFERCSLGLMPVLDAVITVLDMVVDGWSRIFNLADEMLVPVFTELFTFIDKSVMPVFESVVNFMKDGFLAGFELVTKAFDFFADIFKKNVVPVVDLIIETFFDIVDAIREAISNIPFVGGEFKPIDRPQRPNFAQGVSSTSSNINNSQSTVNVNVSGMTTDQINELIRKAQQKQSSISAGSW